MLVSLIQNLPNLLDAIEITRKDGTKVILECQKHIGEDSVRTVAMDSTDGLMRGMEAVAVGKPISMPTGEEVKGRLFNEVGDPIDGIDPVEIGEKITNTQKKHQSLKIFLHLLKSYLQVLR